MSWHQRVLLPGMGFRSPEWPYGLPPLTHYTFISP